MTNFLPDDYDIPMSSGNYTKLQEGENTLRILSSPIMGFERWTTGERLDGSQGKIPVRKRMDEDLDPQYGYGGSEGWRHFWAMIVWNFDTSSLQVWNVTQKTIMRKIKTLDRNPKWGGPKDYDIVVSKLKTGEDPRDVDYEVTPSPKETLDPEIVKLYDGTHIDLEALFDGQDPFSEDVKPEEVKV